MAIRVEKIESLAKMIIHKGRTEDKLGEITIKSVRREIERKLGLEEGDLDGYKKEIKVAVNWALEHEDEEDVPDPLPVPHSKGKEGKQPKSLKRKSSTTDDQSQKKSKTNGGEAKTVRKSDDVRPAPTSESSKPTKKAAPELPEARPENSKRTDDVSDTELSSLYDEAPAKRTKKTTKKAERENKSAKRSKEKREMSHDGPETAEEEVTRLKKLVVACGVRKVWSKELTDLSPRDQVKKVKEMLRGLGMTGRMSLEQAKRIKEKRELAQEIEDVVEYEKERGLSAGTRTTRRAAAEAKKERDPDGDESDEEVMRDEEEVLATKKRTDDLFAFIGDQSSDED